jgi:very-short-patch-repair endonuclease
MTGHEVAVWKEVRNRQLGVKFRRQVPIGPYIVDFACLARRLVIEVDGSVHDYADESVRTGYLESQGFTVFRFTNDEVVDHGVGGSIRDWLAGVR